MTRLGYEGLRDARRWGARIVRWCYLDIALGKKAVVFRCQVAAGVDNRSAGTSDFSHQTMMAPREVNGRVVDIEVAAEIGPNVMPLVGDDDHPVIESMGPAIMAVRFLVIQIALLIVSYAAGIVMPWWLLWLPSLILGALCFFWLLVFYGIFAAYRKFGR
jgi:hypothetical protein